jgi:hypothetical protein
MSSSVPRRTISFSRVQVILVGVWAQRSHRLAQRTGRLAFRGAVCHTVRMLSGQREASKRRRVDVRVDEETTQLLDDLARVYRSNRSHVVRLAVAELARVHGILGHVTPLAAVHDNRQEGAEEVHT